MRVAATWDQPDRLRVLLGSCFHDGGCLVPALHEAAARGHADGVQVTAAAWSGATVAGADTRDSEDRGFPV